MNYIGWNDILAAHFFKEEMAEKRVNLFITKGMIISIGEKEGIKGDIWKDFVNAITIDLDGYGQKSKLIRRANYWLNERLKNESKFTFPPYINYLVMSIYPFTEFDEKIHAHSYYEPVNSILERDGLPKWSNLNKDYNWLSILVDLEKWSIVEQNLQLGYYEYIKSGGNVYVDFPRTQSLLTPRFYNQFKTILYEKDVEPHSELGHTKIVTLIRDNLNRINLRKNVLDIIYDTKHPLHLQLIDKISNFVYFWDGITDNENEGERKTDSTIAKLFISFEIENSKLMFYYRIFSRAPYPPDLIFEEISCLEEKYGWSKKIKLPFKEQIKLIDEANKWKASFLIDEVLIFIDGSLHGLNGWISTNYLTHGQSFYLLIKKKSEALNKITDFFNSESNGTLKQRDEDYEGIPEDFYLFFVERIRSECKPYLIFKDIKRIEIDVINGIQITGRKYLKYLTPEILIDGISPETKLSAKYLNNGDTFELLNSTKKKSPRWFLKKMNKDCLPYDSPFEIVRESSENSQERLGMGSYELLSSDKFTLNNNLPKFDVYAKESNSLSKEQPYLCGNEIQGELNILRNNERCYGNLQFMFKPQCTGIGFLNMNKWQYDPITDLLLNYLSIKGRLSTVEFFEAFKIINYQKFPDGNEMDINILSRLSLNHYFTSGHISRFGNNYQRVFINPPQIIQMPSDKIVNGTKYLLIGARTKSFMDNILKFCQHNEKFHLSQEKPQEEVKKFLFPTKITLRVNGQKSDQINENIKKFCTDCSVSFQENIIYSLGLLTMLPSIGDYFNSLTSDPVRQVYSVKMKIFDVDNLKFTPIATVPEETGILIEYQFNAYTYIYKYYQNNSSYTVDKNLGIFLTLSRFRKKTICYKNNEGLIIQASTPLPILFSRFAYLLNGELPVNERINERWFLKYINIDIVAADILLEKLDQKGA
ncbi:MAG TPA: hypothetical protein PK559_09645 [Ignavibacteriaceae bacterium]|nr:hypothetical protein [Ignavibacteriaceae bacterium]